MKSTEELKREHEMMCDMLKDGVEDVLKQIAGVHHISVGLKETEGRITDQLCIRIYVQEKKHHSALHAHEVLPSEINGIPTDVNVIPGFSACVDENRYRPLKGGIQITNRIIIRDENTFGTEVAHGTLGCLARSNDDGRTVILSNCHVLMANAAQPGDRIYQPAPAVIPEMNNRDLPFHPEDDMNAIGRIIRGTINEKIDAAIAEINTSALDMASCNEINGLSVNGIPRYNVVLGAAAAIPGQMVFKVGEVSGRTEGRVVDINYPATTFPIEGKMHTFKGQIAIQPVDPAHHFSEKGDSGAVIVNMDNRIVGLLFANNGNTRPQITLANHIDDVLNALNIRLYNQE
ncbi:S1 family peptidase [Chitinophaga rhizophila]|uniref:S1 family peptidase n=1 Tax=Chitinophaga rhizophila TaxID=2866212 RepID=A0ABS7GJJ4_9BACT|nr:S1 family peptidase [Chitinophaga rhizophila]MBW8687877.1 S1 family peptidase [Chitinophaga rhizophila]